MSATADFDLAVDRADVGLYGVRAQICLRCDLGIALALRDEGQDLRLSIAEPFAPAGPIESDGTARGGPSLRIVSPACTASSALTNSRAGNVFDR